MILKKIAFLVITIYFSLVNCFGQDWLPFNDTLIYFYRASDTGDYFTLRTKQKTVTGAETKIHFVDNYIVCDTAFAYTNPTYYAQNGSILGDSMVVVEDTIWIDNAVRFVNNMTLGETLPFSSIESTEITYVNKVDTIIFDMPDSVKYYHISDGTRLIQSKNFGLIHYPKQNLEPFIYYELVGIDHYVGLNFDHHNEIFNFEIGDQFFYRNSFYSGMYDLYETFYTKMVVLDKYILDGKFYYDVTINGGHHYGYPLSIVGNTPYDYPGERVRFGRGCEGQSSYSYPNVMEDGNVYRANLGHGYSISPETGNIVQVIGYKDIADEYRTMSVKVDLSTYNHYVFYPPDHDLLKIADNGTYYTVIYEESFGMVFFSGNAFESSHRQVLIGTIKSGDTLGIVNASILEEQLIQLNLFPNPAKDLLYFTEQLSSIVIIDMTGKQVLFEEEIKNQLAINQLEAGTYLIFGTNLIGERKFTRFAKI